MNARISILGLFLTLFGCKPAEPLPTVSEVDIDRYSGLWYEIARLPNSFQKNCTCTTAEYAVEEGYVRVYNRCWNTEKNKEINVKGKAFPVKSTNNASLNVQFFWPFKGDYNIIALDDQYQVAMVGSKSRKYLWILSRNPQLSKEKMTELLGKAKSLGFPTETLLQTEHPCPK